MAGTLDLNDSNGSNEYETGKAVHHHTDRAVDQSGYESARPKRTFGQKAKRHCARFWWLHLIIFCIIFLIIALCLVYVGLPKIAQDGVNDSSLEVYEMQYLDPTPEHVTLTLKAVLKNPTMYTPTLDAFNASLHLYTDGIYTPIGMVNVPMPNIHVQKPSSNATVDSKVAQILDLAELGRYATAVISDENVTTALVGKTTLHLGKLPDTKVNYNSSSTFKGLNGLKGFNTTGLRLNLTAAVGTPNLFGYAFIPNPSVITIEMGNVTLSLATVAAGIVGNATIENFIIYPGMNSLPMYAVVDQPKILSSLDSDGKVNMSITGTGVVHSGQHLTYYETALKSNVLQLQMNVKQIIADSLASSTTNSTRR